MSNRPVGGGSAFGGGPVYRGGSSPSRTTPSPARSRGGRAPVGGDVPSERQLRAIRDAGFDERDFIPEQPREVQTGSGRRVSVSPGFARRAETLESQGEFERALRETPQETTVTIRSRGTAQERAQQVSFAAAGGERTLTMAEQTRQRRAREDLFPIQSFGEKTAGRGITRLQSQPPFVKREGRRTVGSEFREAGQGLLGTGEFLGGVALAGAGSVILDPVFRRPIATIRGREPQLQQTFSRLSPSEQQQLRIQGPLAVSTLAAGGLGARRPSTTGRTITGGRSIFQGFSPSRASQSRVTEPAVFVGGGAPRVISREAVLRAGVAPESPAALLRQPVAGRGTVGLRQTTFSPRRADQAALLRQEATRATFTPFREQPVFATAGLAPQQASLVGLSVPARQLGVARATAQLSFIRPARTRQTTLFSPSRDVDLLVPFDRTIRSSRLVSRDGLRVSQEAGIVSGFEQQRFTVPQQFNFPGARVQRRGLSSRARSSLSLSGRRAQFNLPSVVRERSPFGVPSFGRITPAPSTSSRPPTPRTTSISRQRITRAFTTGRRSVGLPRGNLLSGTGALTGLIIFQGTDVSQIPRIEVIPRLRTAQRTQTSPSTNLRVVSSPTSPTFPSFTSIPFTPINPRQETTRRRNPQVPRFELPNFGVSGSRDAPRRGRRLAEGFTPSLVAGFLNIRGSPSRTRDLTGLEVRPLNLNNIL